MYVALGARVQPSLFKWWSWVDLNLFYGRSNLVSCVFVWKKGKTMDFSETIVVYDIKLGRCSKLNEYMNLLNIKGQGHSLTLVQGHSDSTIVNFLSLETAKPFEAKFHVEPPWEEELRFVQMVQVTWPIWLPCLYMVKPLKNLLLWNKKPITLTVGM